MIYREVLAPQAFERVLSDRLKLSTYHLRR
jgi:hypothetical protein